MSPTPETHLLKAREVQDLCRIGRTTLHEWRTQGRLYGIQHRTRGPWYYPASQPLLQAALDAVRGTR
jgi:hypothetical protein